MMEQASVFMAETLDNVLSMQKIEDGKFELEMMEFSPTNIISEVICMYGGITKDQNLEIDVNYDRALPKLVIGDSHRIMHVISNLISNAIKFSPKNSIIEVCVYCEPSDMVALNLEKLNQSKRYSPISITVKDSGPGIHEHDQKNLFQSFVQIRPGGYFIFI